jgi:1,4-dihydroxy-2-naphthoate octaprenyltransferase
VAGSYFAQTEHWDWEAFALSVPVGLLAASLLVVNNVRDIDTDRRAGKRTVAVKLGRQRTRGLYATMLALAFVTVPVTWLAGSLDAWVMLAWLTIPIAARLVQTVREHTDGPTLNRALAGTSMLELVFCLLLSLGVLLSS